MLLLGVTVHTQDSLNYSSDEFSKIAIIQSPGSWDDGFSIGIQYEHENSLIYYGGELYVFPNLHNMSYYHLIGRFGVNFCWIENIRTYTGVRGGLINREGSFGYALLGAEAGIDWFIFKRIMFIGVSAIIDEKTDSKRWGRDDSHTVKSGIVRIGITF